MPDVQQAAPSENAADVTGERLLATPPPGWQRIYQLNGDSTRLSDFVPAGQSATDWTLKLSFEAISAGQIDADPVTLLMSEAKADMSACNFVQHHNVHSGYENNYETSVRLFMCGENSFVQKGEVKLVKAIRGNDYYYSIRIVRRVPPFEINQPDFTEEQIANWSTYLSRISVCDGSTAHPCPVPSSE